MQITGNQHDSITSLYDSITIVYQGDKGGRSNPIFTDVLTFFVSKLFALRFACYTTGYYNYALLDRVVCAVIVYYRLYWTRLYWVGHVRILYHGLYIYSLP